MILIGRAVVIFGSATQYMWYKVEHVVLYMWLLASRLHKCYWVGFGLGSLSIIMKIIIRKISP